MSKIKFKFLDIISTARILGRKTAGAGQVEELSTSDILDFIGNSTGGILFRSSAGWAFLPKGTNGQSFQMIEGLPAWGDQQSSSSGEVPSAVKLYNYQNFR